MHEIITPRLTLRLMSEEFLEASLNEDASAAESLVGLQISQDWFDEKDLIRVRLADYRIDSEYKNWGLRAVGLSETNEMIGYIGFHSSPNPEYLRELAANAIEFGYTIFVRFRRQNFAVETVLNLMNRAAEQFPLENFIASVAPPNVGSTALIKKLGFGKIGEQIDEVDGLEFVYALAADKLPLINSELREFIK